MPKIPWGVNVIFEEKTGYPPLTIAGQGLSGGETPINPEQSSQYLSGLLLKSLKRQKKPDVTILLWSFPTDTILY